MKAYFFLVLLILKVLIITGCTFSKAPDNIPYDYTLLKAGELTLPLDYDASVEIFLSTCVQDDEGGEKLLLWNHIKNGIDVYKVESQEAILQHKIRIPVEGPGSLIMQGFSLLGKDSIAIFPKGKLSGGILVNFAGEVIPNDLALNKIRSFGKSGSYDDFLLAHTSNNTSPTIYFDNKLFFFRLPLADLSKPENINTNFDFEYIFDLNTRTGAGGNIHYPDMYHHKIWSINALACSRTKGHDDWFVYSWDMMDSLLITNHKGKTYQVYAGTDKFSRYKLLKKPFVTKASLEEQLQVVMDNFVYKKIIYDPYRKVYYRIGLQPMLYTPDELMPIYIYFKPIVLILLDHNFNKIGEVQLPAELYDTRGIFVGKEGLYIPQTNLRNKALSENVIVFSRYIPVLQ
ncbi:MAG TPA: DUF4221 family protein [Saprospiraceae bacterium]|nr:DUF4221 family protein [Saprospiraceae bacterium]HMP25844.1 DUF4221 family protein [Saprospiraceae bacterium]